MQPTESGPDLTRQGAQAATAHMNAARDTAVFVLSSDREQKHEEARDMLQSARRAALCALPSAGDPGAPADVQQALRGIDAMLRILV